MRKSRRSSIQAFPHTPYAFRLTFYVLHLTIILVLLGVPVSHGWIDGTPYFFDHFPGLKSPSAVSSAPAQPNAPQLAVGDRKSFFSINFNTHEQYIVQATLRAVGEFCYVFVEDLQWRRTVHAGTVESVRRAFDDTTPADARRGIYQIETDLFGAPPDVDGDQRIYLLLLDIRDGATRGSSFVAGFFSPVNQQRGVLRHPEIGIPVRSNELDMLYIDTHPLDAGSDEGLGVLAHEFQHLIHWRHDTNETVWVNEGCSDYAIFICGYSVQGHVGPFERNPWISLVYWPNGTQSQLAHYGAAYLWMLYLHEHYGGPETIVEIVKNRANGIAGVESALLSRGIGRTFSGIYADWKVANYLDDTEFANGQYGYQNERLTLRSDGGHRSYPASAENRLLDSYAANYITFFAGGGNSELNIAFESDRRQPYDVKAVEFRGEQPAAVRDMLLTETGKGNLRVPNFGSAVEKVILIPSVQPQRESQGRSLSSYAYSARRGGKVEFSISILPNPVHQRYWDIIAVPSDSIGVSAPRITVREGAAPIVSKLPMKAIQDGAIYVYPLYLSPEVTPENVGWQVFFLDELVEEGDLKVK
ncbi:MAG: hypothetical protein O7E52_20985 [Candidatus Poribacteria bacterium]|nr:hypothetical protein [Candidatus Poribacteria bacterium]